MNNFIKKYESILHPVMYDERDEIISHMIGNKAFMLAEELNAKYKHKVMGYIPIKHSWGNDNPSIDYEEGTNTQYRAIVMEAENNLPSYFIYYHDDEGVWGICSPKNIKERGSRHVTTSKKLSSIMKAIKDREAIPKNINVDIFNMNDGYTINRTYVKHVADIDSMMSNLNHINLRGSVLGVLLQKALGRDVDISGQVEKTARETLDNILQKEQDIESGITDKLSVFDKPVKVLGYVPATNTYYQYDMKIDDAVKGNEAKLHRTSPIEVSNTMEKLSSFDKLSGLLTMWKVTLPEVLDKRGFKVVSDYFVKESWGDSMYYSEGLGIITHGHERGCLAYLELAFLNLE